MLRIYESDYKKIDPVYAGGAQFPTEKIHESGVEITDKVLKSNGYHKVGLEKEIVQKVVLSIEEQAWFEKHKELSFAIRKDNLEDSVLFFYAPDKHCYDSFIELAKDFANRRAISHHIPYGETMERLCKAYFNGYCLEEKTYYLEIHGHDSNERYLAINTETGEWFLADGSDTPEMKSLFTDKELEELSEDPNFSWLSVDKAKVLAPKDYWII